MSSESGHRSRLRVPWFRRWWRRRRKLGLQTELIRLREGDFLIVSSNELIMPAAKFATIKRHFDEAFAPLDIRVIVVPAGFKFHVARIEVPRINLDFGQLSDSEVDALRRRVAEAFPRR